MDDRVDLYLETCIAFHESYVEVTHPFVLHGVTIPKGFICNGVSWPFLNRFARPWLYEAIYHDFIYTTHVRSRHAADYDFADGLIDRGVSIAAATAVFVAVRMFGWIYW